MALTPKQQRFVDEYPVDLNATQAYIRAGYSGKGATQSAARLLVNANVAAAIQQNAAGRSERLSIEADMVLQRTAALAFADPRTVATWDDRGVSVRDSAELTSEQAATVAEVTHRVTKEGSTVTVKLRDPTPHLLLLARYFGMLQPGASDEPPADQPMYWKLRDPRSDLRIIDQPPVQSNGAS